MKIILKKKREIKKNLLLLFISIVFTIIFLEIFLRLFLPQKLYNDCLDPYHPRGNGIDVVLSNITGWVNKPDYEGCRYQPDTNKKVYIRYNSKGLRLDQEVSYKKNNGKKRIALLGDSFVNGNSLDQDETIAYKLQEKLGDSWMVLPLSSDGYGTDLEYLFFKNEGLKYMPDIVVLFFYQNDFTDCSSAEGQGIKKPKFVISNKSSLALAIPHEINWLQFEGTPVFNKKPISKFFLSKSHFYSLIHSIKDKLGQRIVKKELDSEHADSTLFSVLRDYKYKGTDMESAFTIVLTLFKYLKELSDKNSFEFIVVNIPSKINVNEKYQKRFAREYDMDLDICCQFNKVNIIFNEAFKKLDVTYLDLYDIAKNNFNDFYFKSDGHWSPEGVEMTADYLYNELSKQGLI